MPITKFSGRRIAEKWTLECAGMYPNRIRWIGFGETIPNEKHSLKLQGRQVGNHFFPPNLLPNQYSTTKKTSQSEGLISFAMKIKNEPVYKEAERRLYSGIEKLQCPFSGTRFSICQTRKVLHVYQHIAQDWKDCK